MSLSYILESVISGLLLGGIYALLSVGFGLTWGTMKVLNISHAVLAILGSYLAYWLFVKAGVDPIVSLPLVVVALFIIGGLIYRIVIRPVMKTKDVIMTSMVTTFGLSIILENLMSYFWHPDPRILKPSYTQACFFVGDIAISKGPLIGFSMAVIAISLIYLFLHHTYTGKAVQATWQNPIGSALVGINPEHVSLITFGLSIASAGAAGVAMAFIYAFYPSIQGFWTLFVFLVTIVGGVESVIGAGIAGLLIGFIMGISSVFLPFVWANIVLFIFLLVILLLKPKGLFGS